MFTKIANKTIRIAATLALLLMLTTVCATADTIGKKKADPALNGEWLWNDQCVVSFDNGKVTMLDISTDSMMRGTYRTTSDSTYDEIHSIFYEEYNFETGKWETMDKTESGTDAYTLPDDNTLLLREEGEFLTFKRGSYLKEYMAKISAEVKQNLAEKDLTLVVWSFTDEVEGMIEDNNFGYKRSHPNMAVEYSLTPTDMFSAKLDSAFSSGRECPDVFALESFFVRKYIEEGSKFLLPLDDVYAEIKDKMAEYPMQVGTYKGHVYGMAWQICPGAVFYRRSIAKQILGTDDPVEVQKYMSDFTKFRQLTELIDKRSNGSVKTVSSTADLFLAYKASRKNPWVANGKLVIDPAMEDYMEMCKVMHDKGYDGKVGQWSEGWFAGMKDCLRDERGENIKVFCYFLPTWGLHYVLKTNTWETSGDWAMCQGPAKYYWGGTWLAAYKGTKNPKAAKEMIKYLVSDDKFCKGYAQKTGDTLCNLHTQDAIKDEYSESFLNGQNHYKEFCKIAKGINGSLTQSTDQAIEELWHEAVYDYVMGEKSKQDALSQFKSKVKTKLGF